MSLSMYDFRKAQEQPQYSYSTGQAVATGVQSGIDFMKNQNSTNGTSMWESLNKNMSTVADISSAFSGLANTYLGYQNYKLAKEQFSFEKELTKVNLANQATLVNNQIDASANIAAGLSANPLATASQQATDRQKIMDSVQDDKVKGTI